MIEDVYKCLFFKVGYINGIKGFFIFMFCFKYDFV